MSGPSVLVVSTNPAVDVEWTARALVPEEKNEVLGERRWPGGKGANVARWLRHAGLRHRLLLPLGGATGREFAVGLRREGIGFRAVPIAGATRANIVVTTRSGTQYRLNPTWPRLDPSELAALEDALAREVPRHRVVVLSGALVRGADPAFYARWTRRARAAGALVVVDCDGIPFRRAVRARPTLVKPNEFELAQWAGRDLSRPADRDAALLELARVTGGWALLSRGADGASIAGPGIDGILSRPAPRTRVRNTVGAGDAMLAGAIAAMLAHPSAPARWLRAGVATGSLATRQEPGRVPTSRSSPARASARRRSAR